MQRVFHDKGCLGGKNVFFVCSAHDDLEHLARQGTLQRLGLVPGRVHTDVAVQRAR